MSSRTTRLVAAAVALVAVVVVVALVATRDDDGGSPATTAEVQQAVVTARNRADFSFERITKSQDVDDFLDRMNEASGNIGDAASELDELNAPDPYAEEVDNLVVALDQLSVDLSATAADLERPELLGDLVTGARGINFDSWDEANRALAALIGLGIEVDLLQRY